MEWDEEHGIPGHAAKSQWASSLQRLLSELGAPFEAEGEATRIKIYEGVVAEIREADREGYAVEVTVPLPPECGEGCEVEYYSEAYEAALRFLSRLKGSLHYFVDDSLPGYPLLRIRATYSNPYELADDVARAATAYFSKQLE